MKEVGKIEKIVSNLDKVGNLNLTAFSEKFP